MRFKCTGGGGGVCLSKLKISQISYTTHTHTFDMYAHLPNTNTQSGMNRIITLFPEEATMWEDYDFYAGASQLHAHSFSDHVHKFYCTYSN